MSRLSITAQNGLFQLDTQNTSYRFRIDEHGVPVHLYYGARLPVDAPLPLPQRRDIGFSGNPGDVNDDRGYSLDTLPQEIPCGGSGDFRDPMLELVHANGALAADLRCQGHEILPRALPLPGLPALYGTGNDPGETLIVTLKDTGSDVYAKLIYGVFARQDILTRSVVIENRGASEVTLERVLSLAVDLDAADLTMTAFCGRYAMERLPETCPVGRIKAEIGSVRGHSSHHYNPAFLLSRPGATETAGECWGFCFAYSGNFIASAQVDQTGRTRVLLGIHPRRFRWRLEPGQSFSAPQVLLSYSGAGAETLSHHFHDVIRAHLCRGPWAERERPLLLNSWEAAYFAFDRPKLLALARQAAALGIEMLVLDDGWFGERDCDERALGDWFANTRKLGGTLGALAADIRALGLRFGLWVEPEMISEDSDLYRAHPDWAAAVPDRPPVRSRGQLVLDMTRADVRDWLFACLYDILNESKADYLKWDFNRSVSDAFSAALPPERMGEFYHRFILGTYDLLERLRAAFPALLIEGCCGGGGRFDAGMLYYTPQIWCSDDTDAVDRVSIQYGTSFFYPASTVGAHVSACPNAQTGRSVPLATRAEVALAGTFGYELDPARLTEVEKDDILRYNKLYHRANGLVRTGVQYRLSPPRAELAAWAFAARDGSCLLVTVVRMRPGTAAPPIPLRGLDAHARYRCAALGETHTGAEWMAAGLCVERELRQYEAALLLLERVGQTGDRE